MTTTMAAQGVLSRDLADVQEALADPGRIARIREDHQRALRKLATAVQVAAHSGATWDEIRTIVEQAVSETVNEGQGPARLAARMRAMAHNGDDQF